MLNKTVRDLVDLVRNIFGPDLSLGRVCRRIRVLVKMLLKKYGYLPDMRQVVTDIVFDQAKLLCKDWAEVIG